MRSKAPGLVVGGSKGNWLVEQRIDLGELFGSQGLSDSFKKKVAQRIIDEIIKRADENKSIDGRRLASYDDDYVKSDEFKAYGKSKNDVDMNLTGNMLNMLTIKEVDSDTAVIGWTDKDNNGKAHGHMTGANGTGKLPVREFFGANQKLLEEIKDLFYEELPKKDDENNRETLSALEILARAEALNSRPTSYLDFFWGDNGSTEN
jgi:phage gpG-like protein